MIIGGVGGIRRPERSRRDGMGVGLGAGIGEFTAAGRVAGHAEGAVDVEAEAGRDGIDPHFFG